MTDNNENKIDATEDELSIINAYSLFRNGDGHEVYQDLLFAFRDFKSDAINEELEEIPHPYREYVKAGARMVMDRITMIMKLSEEI